MVWWIWPVLATYVGIGILLRLRHARSLEPLSDDEFLERLAGLEPVETDDVLQARKWIAGHLEIPPSRIDPALTPVELVPSGRMASLFLVGTGGIGLSDLDLDLFERDLVAEGEDVTEMPVGEIAARLARWIGR